MPEVKLEDWKPQEPWQGPPLPEFLNIYWPFYKPEVPPEVPEELDFDLSLPGVTPAEVYPGTAITITCPVTSMCTSQQTITAKCIIYEGSILPTHGTKITQKSSPAFSIDPGETYNVTICHTAVKGTIDRRDIEVEIYIGGKLVKQNEWDDVYYVKPVEEAVPQATITSMDWGKTPKRQGDIFSVKVHIQSNFAGTVWTIAAFGEGEPTNCCQALYDPTGNFMGFFPIGFDLVHTPDIYGYANIGSLNLKKGDNIVTVKMSIDRRYPPGSYIGYFGVFPPAANWYSWDPPYDWAVTEPFEIIGELPQIRYLIPYVYAEMSCYSGTFEGASTAVDIGSFDKTNNYICGFNVMNFAAHPDWCTKRDYYMKFKKPGRVEDQPILGCSRYFNDLHMGVFIWATPPETIHGTPAKTYQVDIDAVLVKPDGTKERKTLSDRIPTVKWEVWRKEWFFEVFSFKDMAIGKYTFAINVKIEGEDYYSGSRDFSVV